MNRLFLWVTVLVGLLLASGDALAAEKPKKPLSGYNVIVVAKYEVGTLPTMEGFPRGFEGLVQKTTVTKFIASRLFKKVIDAGESAGSPTGAAAAPEEAERRIILSGTVIGFDPGSRAARTWIGFGAGSTKVKVRFVFRDGESGQEVFRTDRQGKFAGTFSLGGGTTETGTREAAEKVVEGLIKDIQKKR